MDKDIDGIDPNRMYELWILAKRAGYAGSGVKNYHRTLKGLGIPILETGKSIDCHLVRGQDLWDGFNGKKT
jgi:hypothetical protein